MKKRIAFLSSKPLDDKRNWSGTMFNLYQNLEKQGYTISWIPLPQYTIGENKLFSFIQNVYQKIFNRTFNQHHFFLKSWIASKRLEKKLKKENFDALFVPTYATEIGFLNIKQPIVYLNDATFHQLINYYPAFSGLGYLSKKITAALEKKVLQKANAIIFSSEWASQHARDFYHISPKKIFTVKFGANLPIPEVLTPKNYLGKIKFLFLAVNWERKGGAIAYETIKILHDKGYDVELQIIGCNPNIQESFVKIIPFLNKNNSDDLAQIQQHLLNSHFLFVPTRADCTPIAFCEAAGYGLPVISTDTGGVSATVEHQKTGLLLPIQATANDFAEKIKTYLDHPNEIEQLSQASIIKYKNELNWENWGKEINNIINILLEKKS